MFDQETNKDKDGYKEPNEIDIILKPNLSKIVQLPITPLPPLPPLPLPLPLPKQK